MKSLENRGKDVVKIRIVSRERLKIQTLKTTKISKESVLTVAVCFLGLVKWPILNSNSRTYLNIIHKIIT